MSKILLEKKAKESYTPLFSDFRDLLSNKFFHPNMDVYSAAGLWYGNVKRFADERIETTMFHRSSEFHVKHWAIPCIEIHAKVCTYLRLCAWGGHSFVESTNRSAAIASQPCDWSPWLPEARSLVSCRSSNILEGFIGGV